MDGNNCGFPYIDSGVSACPIASIFPSLVKCRSAIALIVFMVLVENSSPVRPWTINGQGPSVVPSSSSISCTLVDSGFLFELDGWYSTTTGGPSSGYEAKFLSEISQS